MSTECCEAITAECLSCKAGIPVAQYCGKNPKTLGCPDFYVEPTSPEPAISSEPTESQSADAEPNTAEEDPNALDMSVMGGGEPNVKSGDELIKEQYLEIQRKILRIYVILILLGLFVFAITSSN